MKEWMPVNPCDVLCKWYKVQGKPCTKSCVEKLEYLSAIKAQRKLLKYLIAKINACEEPVTLGTLKSMLQELNNESTHS